MTAVLLVNPKTPYNVGSAIRACAIYGVKTLRWTGTRIDTAEGARLAGTTFPRKRRLPREERLKDYVGVDWKAAPDDVLTELVLEHGLTPVAVEVLDNAEPLHLFEHPENALYVFGPEDGTLGRPTLTVCHRFVRIWAPTRTPMNLAAALNVVLYDRYSKAISRSDVFGERVPA